MAVQDSFVNRFGIVGSECTVDMEFDPLGAALQLPDVSGGRVAIVADTVVMFQVLRRRRGGRFLKILP